MLFAKDGPAHGHDSAANRNRRMVWATAARERRTVTAQVAAGEIGESERRVLVAAREHLGMDVSYCSHLNAIEQVIQRVHGDAASFGLTPGTTFALEQSYCRRVIDGRLANLVIDAQRDERVAGLRPSFGSYIGAPVIFSDGRLYGTLCCASHAAARWLGDRDVAFMHVLGRMLAHELEYSEIQRAAQRRRNEAIAITALFAALEAVDSGTARHSEAVVELSVQVTRELGLPENFVEEVKQVALLHDIGKIAIPDAILSKQGPLNDAEWEIMRTHPATGARIVASIDALAPLAPAIRAEHERFDGTGYPDGLSREQIPLASRITFACDAYHAMTSSRPYRTEPIDAVAAAIELRANAGTQFDPAVVAALVHRVQPAQTQLAQLKRAGDAAA